MFNHIRYDNVIEEPLERVENDGVRFYKDSEGFFYKSVTTYLAKFGSKGLDSWRKAVGEEQAKLTGRLAAKKGTNIHTACEKFLNNDADYKKHLFYDELMDWKELEPALKQNLDNILCQEFRLKSKKLKLAGTVDCIAEVNGVLSVIDFKTSSRQKEPKDIPLYWLQCACYAVMMYEMYGIKIKQLCIVMVVNHSHVNIYKEESQKWIRRLLKLQQMDEETNAIKH
ncbi:hypothetical protein [Synechococcus phage BUCT-ZZ01]|nr:hypothetical protein [Synechococcus phage BUCT-ZZ01]